MAYNRETHSKETTIIPIDIAGFIAEDAKNEKRSKSSQIAYILEQFYAKRRLQNELENKNSQHSTGKEIR